MILARSEIQELTGYRQPASQARWLARWKIGFSQNPLGQVVVTEQEYLAALDRMVVPGIPPGEETPAQISAYRALFRRPRLIAQCTPAWANHEAIERFYAEARRLTLETGVRHSVDHVVPINGRKVCGLHVETNLQVITHSANSRKSNRWDGS